MGTQVTWLDLTPDSAMQSWVSSVNTKDLICKTGMIPTSQSIREDQIRQFNSFNIFFQIKVNHQQIFSLLLLHIKHCRPWMYKTYWEVTKMLKTKALFQDGPSIYWPSKYNHTYNYQDSNSLYPCCFPKITLHFRGYLQTLF